MSAPKQLKQPRKFYLDLVRVVAIISISLNHAVNRCYQNYRGQMEEFYSISFASTLFKTIITVFSHIGVPLFLMITGVLILNKKMENSSDIKRFYKRNVLSLFITTEIWYALIYWIIVLFRLYESIPENIGFIEAVWGMIKTMLLLDQVTFDCMWYMPMILCLYTTLPFVIIVKNKLSDSEFSPVLLLPLGIVFLYAMVLPALNSLLYILGCEPLSSRMDLLNLPSSFLLYIIIGYWVGNGALSRLKNHMVAIFTAGSFALCCAYQFYAYSQPLNYLVSYDFPLLPLCAAFLFELLRRTAKYVRKARKPVTYLARISFGIYFVHIIIMTFLVPSMNALSISRPFKVLLLEAVSVGGSILLITPLSKIPLFRKYLFMIK